MFNGFYTVTSTSGEHRTFTVRTQPHHAAFAPCKRIVSILDGPDNNTDYTDFGFVTDTGIRVWKHYRGETEPSFYEKCAVMLWSLAERGADSPYAKRGMQMLLDKRCVRCNRRLTTPASIELGIGPECAGRI